MSYGRYRFTLKENANLFQNDCAIPHSHQQSVNGTVFFASSPAFNLVIF